MVNRGEFRIIACGQLLAVEAIEGTRLQGYFLREAAWRHGVLPLNSPPMDRFVILRGEMARPLQFVASPLPAYARRIKALRQSLSLNQLQFGKRLKCSSMVISRWERGLQKPPADCLIAMGKIAGPPAGWFFWKMAGIHPADARRMLQEDQRS